MFDVVVFDVIHQVSSISFNLLRRGNGTEYDFGETLAGEHSKADTTDWSIIFD